MFGSKIRGLEIKILELEKELNQESARRCELEKQLSDERRAHEEDKRALEKMRDVIEVEKRSYMELQDALRAKLREIEEKDRERSKEIDVQQRRFQEETAEKRTLLEQELRQYRELQMGAVQKRVHDIEKSYCHSLSLLMQAAERVSNTAIRLSENPSDEHTDVAGLFENQIRSIAEDIPPFRRTEKENDSSFTLREGVPG